MNYSLRYINKDTIKVGDIIGYVEPKEYMIPVPNIKKVEVVDISPKRLNIDLKTSNGNIQKVKMRDVTLVECDVEALKCVRYYHYCHVLTRLRTFLMHTFNVNSLSSLDDEALEKVVSSAITLLEELGGDENVKQKWYKV